jgi:cytochrome c biogenesis protein CcdA/glutaredoxin
MVRIPQVRLAAVVVAVLLSLLLGLPMAGAEKPVVRFYLFYSQTCPHCHEVMENYLPTVYAKYGDQLEHQEFDIHNNNANYLKMLGLEKKLGVPEDQQGFVPALFIGDKFLMGGDEIPANLEAYIDEYLAQGGVDYPSMEGIPTPAPAVEALVFFDRTHSDFEKLNSFITSLGTKYGERFIGYGSDLSQAENAEKLSQLNALLGGGTPKAGTPEVLVDHTLLVGLREIEARLPGLIDDYLAKGGVGVRSWDELLGTGGTDTGRPPIYIAFFSTAGCQECARTVYDLQVVQSRYPQVQVETFPMEESNSKLLNEWLSSKFDVPEEKRLSTPMLFVGQDVLIGQEANLDNILAAAAKYATTGADRTWTDFDPAQANQSLLERFRSFGVLTVLGAGLIDGLNPCAFATLVFFISYMAFTGRRGRDILLVGIAFALGVFLTYLLVGVGLLKVIQSLSFFTALGRWVYLLTALLCAALAALTFRDYMKARRGQASEMTLKLPMSLRRRINQVIREGAQARAAVAVAFVTGFVVSLIELACTGQVYLPTIMFVLSVPELAAKAYLYLLLYCIMFIVPLVVVFVLSYLGTTSEQLAAFVGRHTATIKLLTGFLFAALAAWMTLTLAPLFGVHPPWNWVLLGVVLAAIAIGAAVLRATEKPAARKPAPRRRKSRA